MTQPAAAPADRVVMSRARPPAPPAPVRPAAGPHVYPGIDAVIDARAVSTVFQPLVRLDTGEVVGYEALSRGPAGTAWESPAALFGAAREVGREAELDWVCRALAYRAAVAGGLDATTTLFVNMEPAALRSTCPPDLRTVLDTAGARLRVVVEMTERAIGDDPSGLLTAAAITRMRGHGVALDDVGADPASLALMPFVHPDVIKLDMHLLDAWRLPHAADVVNAVAAYAERSGATILAEGIETAAHVQIARTMGATLGQGWLFGRPGPLPRAGHRVAGSGTAAAAGPALLSAPDTAAPGTRRSAATPYDIVAAVRPAVTAAKPLLIPASRYLEAKAGHGGEHPVVLACFQRAVHFTPATSRIFSDLAGSAALVAAYGEGLPSRPVAGVRGVDLAADDPLVAEWNVVVVGPHFAAALVARDRQESDADGQRLFDHAITYDRELVLAAARSLLHRLG